MLSSSPRVLTLNSQTGRSRSSAAFRSANRRASGSHLPPWMALPRMTASYLDTFRTSATAHASAATPRSWSRPAIRSATPWVEPWSVA